MEEGLEAPMPGGGGRAFSLDPYCPVLSRVDPYWSVGGAVMLDSPYSAKRDSAREVPLPEQRTVYIRMSAYVSVYIRIYPYRSASAAV